MAPKPTSLKAKVLEKVVKVRGEKNYSPLKYSNHEDDESDEEFSVLIHSNSKDKVEEPKKAEVHKIPVLKLFRAASYGDRFLLVVGCLAAVFHGAAPPALAIVFGGMTDSFLGFGEEPSTDSTLGMMKDFAFYYLMLAAWVLLTTAVQAFCWERSCENQVYKLRMEYFRKVLGQRVSWHDTQQTGKLCSQLTDDLERVREGIGHKCSYIIQYASTAVFGFIVGFLASWKLTLLFVVLTPFLTFATAITGTIMANSSSREQNKYGDAGAEAQQVLASIRTVAAFSGEWKALRKYKKSLAKALKIGQMKVRPVALSFAAIGLLTYLAYAAAIWYGTRLLIADEITPGKIFTVFFSALTGGFAIGSMLPFVTMLGLAQGAAVGPFQIIEKRSTLDMDSDSYIDRDYVGGEIEFDGVGFSYPTRPDVEAIKHLYLKVEKGKKIAFVGSSGAGKTTLLNLLLRFYDPTFGSIKIDGLDLQYINPNTLRQSIIGVVTQEPVLFSTTIFENIALGGRDGQYVTFQDVIEAAKLAQIHDFIAGLPKRYHTMVGDSGSQLSAGQKQRIAIARAIVGNPKILILDEATSALDVNSEKEVQNALNNVMKGRTTVIIAHRLNTIRNADQIYFLQSGAVVESGSHDELMAKSEHYYNHVISQQLPEQETNEKGILEENFVEEGLELEKNQEFNEKVLHQKDEASHEDEGFKPPGLWGMIKFMKPEWETLSIGILGSIIVGAVPVVFAYLYGMLFHLFSLEKGPMERESNAMAVMFVVLALISGTGMWMRNYVGKTGELLALRLRAQSFAAILRQPIAWFEDERNSPGNLLTRLSSDAAIVKGASSHRLSCLATASVTIKLSVTLSMIAGWRLALLLTAVYPLITIAAVFENKVMKRGAGGDRTLKQQAGTTATEAISSIRTVQALGKEEKFISRYDARLTPALKKARHEAWGYALLVAFAEAIIYATYAAGFTMGAYWVDQGKLTVNSVYKVFFAVAFSAPSVGQIISMVPDYNAAREAVKHIFKILSTKSPIDPFSKFGARPRVHGTVTFDNVFFAYPQRPTIPTLSGISFTLNAGQTLAVVGESGAGKSTIISLLERFYDPVAGQVMIDDCDVRKWNLRYLRNAIGYVSQETFLFDTTIFNNIAYGYKERGHPTQLDVEEAAKIANAHDFILKLPEGYQTVCGERGVLLSGGQKQRIAIARAILRDPKILLLDEATSSLDPVSEKVVQDALDVAKKGRTCIIIAHRLSTIRNADNIIVMRKGRVAEHGTHSELLLQKGIYYSFVQTQEGKK